MEGRCSTLVTRVTLTAIIIAFCWVGSISCYKLELDDAVKNDMRNLTCESYCVHCNCSGIFLEQENKCVCSCDDETPADATCLAEIEGMRDLIGLDYAIEVRQATSDESQQDLEPHVRVSRQVSSRRRSRNRRQRGRRTRGRRPVRSRSRRGRRPGSRNLVGAPAPTPVPGEVVAEPGPDV